MATRLKVVEDLTASETPPAPEFVPAPTRKQVVGWTADRQRKFIEHLSLSGSVGEAAALAGVSSRSAYRLRNKAGAESFARAWDAALSLSATRLAAITFDRALHGRAERFYKDGELVMERRMPSDYLLTWLLARLDPLQFGSPSAKALAAASPSGDARTVAATELPALRLPHRRCAGRLPDRERRIYRRAPGRDELTRARTRRTATFGTIRAVSGATRSRHEGNSCHRTN